MRLTFSKLDTYGTCPLRFQLRYHEKLPETPRSRGRNLSLILHKTLEFFLYNARRDPSLEALQRAYENRCTPPQTPAQERRFQEEIHALEAFHWREGHRLATAVALEQRFSVRAEGIEITGRLDCALEPEVGLELIDFKFTSSIPENPDPLQLQLYRWGLEEVTGSTADTLTYYYLRQEQRVSFPGGDRAIQQGKELAIRTAEQLQGDSSFSPQDGPWGPAVTRDIAQSSEKTLIQFPSYWCKPGCLYRSITLAKVCSSPRISHSHKNKETAKQSGGFSAVDCY